MSARHWRRIGWGLAAALLLLPAIAMQFTSEVNWGPEDFLAAALLLGTAGLGLELTARLPRWRLVAGCCVVGAVLLMWLELAVGLVGPG